MKRAGILFSLGLAMIWAVPLAAQQLSCPFTITRRLELHAAQTVGPASFAATAVSAAVNQWRDHPREWGQGMEGYGRRFGYRFAHHAAGQGVEFTAGALLGEDQRYRPSQRQGFWPRTRYAVRSAFFVLNREGGERFAFSRMAGNYGGALIADTWLPPRLTGADHVLLRGTISFGWDVAHNFFQEFWPDLKRKLLRR